MATKKAAPAKKAAAKKTNNRGRTRVSAGRKARPRKTEAEVAMLVTFGEKLKSAREACGETQLEFAARAGLHLNSVRVYEQGRVAPTLLKLYRLADLLGVQPSTLLP